MTLPATPLHNALPDDRDQALLDLLHALAERSYAFVTPTNAAIRRGLP